MRFFSNPSRKPSLAGYTLVELMVTIGLVAGIVWMSMGVYARVRAKAMRGACIIKVKSIGTALHTAMITREDGYPSPPEQVEESGSENDETDKEMDEWWFNNLKDFGLDDPRSYVCPNDMKRFEELQRDTRLKYFSSYTIVPNNGKTAPLQPRTPWVVDKNTHDGKNVVYFGVEGAVLMELLPQN
jgi:hypothetical protein